MHQENLSEEIDEMISAKDGRGIEMKTTESDCFYISRAINNAIVEL